MFLSAAATLLVFIGTTTVVSPFLVVSNTAACSSVFQNRQRIQPNGSSSGTPALALERGRRRPRHALPPQTAPWAAVSWGSSSSSSPTRLATSSSSADKEALATTAPITATGAANTYEEAFQICYAQLLSCAQRTSRDDTAVEKAETALREFLATNVDIDIDEDKNNPIELYNLLWETYAYAIHRPDGADVINLQMQEMLRVGESAGASVSAVAHPNLKSFTTLMDAYTQRFDAASAEQVVHLIKAMPDLEPDVNVFNKLIRAYGVTGQPDKARRVVQYLLQKMDEEEKSGENNVTSPSLRPDAKTWMHWLRALAAKGLVDEIQDCIRNVMLRGYRLQGRRSWAPNVHSYNAWMRAILYGRDDDFSGPQNDQIEHLLYDMINLYRQEEEQGNNNESRETEGGDVVFGMRPNSQTFYLVLQSFRGSTHPSTGDKVDRILEIQRGLALESGDDALYPDTRTYNTAISVLSRTYDSQKAWRARRILKEMDPLDFDLDDSSIDSTSHSNAKPDLITLRNILNACAYTRGTAQDRKVAFQVALESFNQVRHVLPKNNNRRTHETMVSIYELFMMVVFQMMAHGPKQDEVVEKVFHKCCQEGYLSDRFLQRIVLRQASKELRLRLLAGFTRDGLELPSEWSRNVRR